MASDLGVSFELFDEPFAEELEKMETARFLNIEEEGLGKMRSGNENKNTKKEYINVGECFSTHGDSLAAKKDFLRIYQSKN